MNDVSYHSHDGKPVLLIDLAGISDPSVVPDLIGKATRLAQSGEGPGSVRTLIDLSGTHINREIRSALQSLSRNNGRYARATAFVGMTRAWSMVLAALFHLRGKANHKVFRTRAEALHWLGGW